MAKGFNAKHVFAHRGMWSISKEANTLKAIGDACLNDFSIETDLRSSENEVYISHDVSNSEELLSLKSLSNLKCQFALNIKQDGLGSLLEQSRDWISETDSFLFVGSIPEMIKIKNSGFRHALRLSEHEQYLPWTPDYIWLDSFNSEWWLNNLEVEKLIKDSETKVVVVSPELHGREKRFAWDYLANLTQNNFNNVSICTDFPREFLKYVNS